MTAAQATHLAALTDLPDQAASLHLPAGAEQVPSVIVLRQGAELRAYANRCPHFGVPLARRSEHLHAIAGDSLQCSVHYARFNWQDGHCLSGECAGEGLQPMALHLIDGHVFIASEPR